MLVALIIYTLFISFDGLYNYDSIQNIDGMIIRLNILYFAVSVLYLWIKRRKNLFCPEFILSIIFYIGSYLVGFAEVFDFRSIYVFDSLLVVQALSLVSIGWMFFIIGALIAKTKKTEYACISSYSNTVVMRNIFLLLFIIMMVWHLWVDGGLLLNKYKGAVGTTSAIHFYVILLSILLSYCEFSRLKQLRVNNFRQFIKQINKIYLFSIGFIAALTFGWFGDRSSALQIIIPVMVLYYLFIKKIGLPSIFTILVTGLFLSILVKDTRQSSVFSFDVTMDVSDMVGDFISVNAATPVLIQYTDKNGFANGGNMLDQVLAIIPFAQSIFLDPNKKLAEKSSIINSVVLLGDDYYSGQGTNVVGDLYYTFGLCGVILGMMLVGWFYSYLFNDVVNGNLNNQYNTIILLILFGNIIYFVRVEYTFILRSLSFGLIIYWLVSKFTGQKK
ncbi:MAG: O-antigen polymerase [Acinetobacter sp.]